MKVDVWTVQVGRVPVLLLDTDSPVNDPADRPITNILYVRGREMWLHQELILGIGGVRPAGAGHRAGRVASQRRPLGVPARRAGAELVVAGDDLEDGLREGGWEQCLHDPYARLGRQRAVRCRARPDDRRPDPRTAGRKTAACRSIALQIGIGTDNDASQFDMTALSLRLTRGANAVSKSARYRQQHRRGVPKRDILAITNGIHTPTWVGGPIRELYERYLDADLDDLDNATEAGRWWERLDRIPSAELWAAHLRQKREFAVFARGRLRTQFARHGEAPRALQQLADALDPDVLTIGFARRFATYKRSGMIFTDKDRLARLLSNEERPVQLVFAGKAIPRTGRARR